MLRRSLLTLATVPALGTGQRTGTGQMLASRSLASSWLSQRRGANCFNREVSEPWLRAAKAAKIQTVRLSYEKWGGVDHLLGSADDYRQLNPAHLKGLVEKLDRFSAHGIGVVLTPLSLPGARWRQMNGNRRDGRLWKDRRYWEMARRFWQDLADAVKAHPAIAALDLLNEPAPELEWKRSGFWDGQAERWYETVRGTPGDLNEFHRYLVEGIRRTDTQTTIVVESGLFATPWALPITQVLPDPRILYSIHMYEPYEYTTWRKHQGRLKYPGSLLVDEGGRQIDSNAAWLDRFFDPVRAWMKQNQLPPERLLIGEFGCGRRCPGAATYLDDLLRIFNRERWHWLFYGFREDTWEGMDYELGTRPPPEWYWALSEKGGLEKRYAELYAGRQNNDVWQAIARHL